MKKKVEGFTLVESLFVVAIMMIIMMIVIPNVTQKNRVVKDKGCEAMLEMVNSQIQLYELEFGELPDSIEDLIDADYLKENQRNCPNGDLITITDGQAGH